MIGGAFLGGGVELVPAGQCKIELQIMTEDRQNLTGTFTLTDGTHTYSVTAGADGRASVNVASGGTYTVTISNTGYDNISAQTVVSASATVKYVRFELPTANVKIGGAQTITGVKTFTNSIWISANGERGFLVKRTGREPADGWARFRWDSIRDKNNKNVGQILSTASATSSNMQIIADYPDVTNESYLTVTILPSGTRYVTASNRPYANAGSSDVLVKGHIADIPDLVHTTGNETIAGEKTFTSAIRKDVNGNNAVIIVKSLTSSTHYNDIAYYTSDDVCRAFIRHSINTSNNSNSIYVSLRSTTGARIGTEFGIFHDANGLYCTCPSRAYSASNTTDIVNIASLESRLNTKITYGTADPSEVPAGGVGTLYIKHEV